MPTRYDVGDVDRLRRHNKPDDELDEQHYMLRNHKECELHAFKCCQQNAESMQTACCKEWAKLSNPGAVRLDSHRIEEHGCQPHVDNNRHNVDPQLALQLLLSELLGLTNALVF